MVVCVLGLVTFDGVIGAEQGVDCGVVSCSLGMKKSTPECFTCSIQASSRRRSLVASLDLSGSTGEVCGTP